MFLLVSCATPGPDHLVTIHFPPHEVTAYPEIFEKAYFDGASSKMDTVPIDFYTVEIGELKLPSGRIVACDNVNSFHAKPFVQQFPTGQFPVQLAIAKIATDERVAYARVRFTNEPVTKWEYALLGGQAPMPIGGKQIYGYGVDAGTGMFLDEKANIEFNQLYDKDPDIYNQVFVDIMERNYRPTWSYLIHSYGHYNLAAFSTGYGDGTYSTFVGYDNKGKICQLLTDFALVNWWDY
ncbi:hypothetical protein FPE01S_01_04110 [Flavihumibacter petaseus NBRC 106054]|uniref:DUF4241 domain-containing protein n=2 Tax=Flavihumibacter TaxID=1004301 RepID=A0A0E9MV13_9BACT|nr:hypothetical protein FPE01S_01_04110 [Flavihumibacter petaseus NBRC 106054]